MTKSFCRLLAALALPLLGLPARAQTVNPADKARPPQDQEEGPPELRGRSWELPPTVVRAERGRYLREEDLIGPNKQPRWTARRLFPTTRVYVRPPGQLEFEFWTRAMIPREGKATVENQYELEVGLPGRFQLDLYAVTEKEGAEGPLNFSEQKFELRWALAEWGRIWMNPTLYLEYVERDAKSDKIEYKLLLGDQLAPGWHFGSNLIWEHELGDELENEYELTLGLAHTVLDERLSIGAEVKGTLVDTHADRGDFTKELEIGPSLQFRPVPNMHIDFAPLIGIGGDSRAADIYLVIGWEF